MKSNELDKIASEIQAAAKKCETVVVHSLISLSEGTPTVGVEASAFADLIIHIQPKLVYMLAIPFDSTEEALSIISDEEDENSEWIIEHKSFKALLNKWKTYDEQTFKLTLGVMCDGALLVAVEEISWFPNFEKEADILKTSIEEDNDIRLQKEEAQRNELHSSNVEILIADPRFTAPKVGIAKRTLLAQTLFPDLNRDDIKIIVEQAENDYWLKTAGTK